MKYTSLPLFVVFALIFTACDEETSAPAEAEYKHVVKTIYTEVTDTLQDTVTTNRTDTIVVYQDSIVHDTLVSNLNCETIEDNGRITITCGENEIQVNKGTCDTMSFDPEKNFCYNGQVMDFCDGYAYNPEKYFCSNDSLILLCGENEYDLSKQFCDGDSIVALCKGNKFNTSQYFCYQDSLVDLCNNYVYDPTKQNCTNDTLYGNCGDTIYSLFKQFCYNDTLYYLCGGKSFNPAKQYCQDNEEPAEFGYFTDHRDNQTYKYVVIGNQTWMAQNLNYAYLQPTAQLDSSSFCYKQEPDSCAKYGRLYMWSAAMDSAALFSETGKGCGLNVFCDTTVTYQGVCPKGWRMPDSTDWDILYKTVGGISTAAKYLRSSNGWEIKSDSTKYTNPWGFSILPAGFMNLSNSQPVFSMAGLYGGGESGFWYAQNRNAETAYYVYVHPYVAYATINTYKKDSGRSIRCIKNND